MSIKFANHDNSTSSGVLLHLLGDGARKLSILVILYQLHVREDGRDISLRTQQLYLLVSLTRYLYLLSSAYHAQWYLSCYESIFIIPSLYILYYLYYFQSQESSKNLHGAASTSSKKGDDMSFRHFIAIVLSAVIVAFIYAASPWYGHVDLPFVSALLARFCWSFSVVLEAVAIVPQLLVVHWNRCRVNTGVKAFCIFQFLYRSFSILDWICFRRADTFYVIFASLQCALIPLPWAFEYLFVAYYQQSLHHRTAEEMKEMDVSHHSSTDQKYESADEESLDGGGPLIHILVE